MMYRWVVIVINLFALHVSSFCQLSPMPSFDISLGCTTAEGKKQYARKCARIAYAADFMRRLKRLYTQTVTYTELPKIPRIIHQIWLGSPLPDHYKQWQKTWQEMHPDWEYKLWTDAEVVALPLYNKDLYDAAVNYGEKSDILRCELLYMFGGVYVDMDIECIRPLDALHHCYDFYTGMFELDACAVLENCIIGCAPCHPIITYYRNSLSMNAQDPKRARSTFNKTGPNAFDKAFYHCLVNHDPISLGAVVALPPSYFFPLSFKDVRRGICALTYEQVHCMCKPETFAIHYWASSWWQAP